MTIIGEIRSGTADAVKDATSAHAKVLHAVNDLGDYSQRLADITKGTSSPNIPKAQARFRAAKKRAEDAARPIPKQADVATTMADKL